MIRLALFLCACLLSSCTINLPKSSHTKPPPVTTTPQVEKTKEPAPLPTKAAPKQRQQAHQKLLQGNNKQAFALYRKGAMQGDPASQFALAYLYRTGKGTPQDYAKAFHWFQKAAHQGYASAQNSLGLRYLYGQGTTKNRKKARYWFEQAAQQGNRYAQNELGYMYSSKKNPDNHKAYYWYVLAAKQNLASAQYNVGLLYANGLGVEQSNPKALYWFKRALANGFHAAKAYIDT
jgi:TPR repeat protein